jgi:hypothetical protein
MLTRNIKVWLVLAAVLAALIILMADQKIEEGTGVIVATLAASAGWLARKLDEDGRAIRNTAQAYASAIETLYGGIADSLSDEELARFERLAPLIRGGQEVATNPATSPDPLADLPDITSQIHLLTPRTVRYVWQWRDRTRGLIKVYDWLGTTDMAAYSAERLTAYFNWARQYRDEYRDVGYTALKTLSREDGGVQVHLERHERDGATERP